MRVCDGGEGGGNYNNKTAHYVSQTRLNKEKRVGDPCLDFKGGKKKKKDPGTLH